MEEVEPRKYRVKVTEEHIAYVWVEAETKTEALERAIHKAKCEFNCVSKAEIVDGVEFF